MHHVSETKWGKFTNEKKIILKTNKLYIKQDLEKWMYIHLWTRLKEYECIPTIKGMHLNFTDSLDIR